MKLGQNLLVELVYNVRRAQFNNELDWELGANNPEARPAFEDLNDPRVVESITAEIRNYYDSGVTTGDVAVDAILETLR